MIGPIACFCLTQCLHTSTRRAPVAHTRVQFLQTAKIIPADTAVTVNLVTMATAKSASLKVRTPMKGDNLAIGCLCMNASFLNVQVNLRE